MTYIFDTSQPTNCVLLSKRLSVDIGQHGKPKLVSYYVVPFTVLYTEMHVFVFLYFCTSPVAGLLPVLQLEKNSFHDTETEIGKNIRSVRMIVPGSNRVPNLSSQLVMLPCSMLVDTSLQQMSMSSIFISTNR